MKNYRCVLIGFKEVLLPIMMMLGFSPLSAGDTVYVSNVRFEPGTNEVIIWYDLHYHKPESEKLKRMLASLEIQDKSVENGSEIKQESENHQESGSGDQEFKVTIALRKDSDEFFRYIPRKVKGDVGVVRGAGRDKRIVWDMSKEFQEGLDGSDFYFEVRTELILHEDMTGWWLGGGAAILGAGLTYLLLSSGNDKPIESGEFPPPPGRPR